MPKRKWKLKTDVCPTCGYARRKMPSRTPMPERFWKKVNKTDTCWLWTGQKMSNREYGVFWVAERGRKELAHRVAWYLATGEWPEVEVLHSCDNPSCVRYDHHFLGTQDDNIQDMIKKGRAAWQNRRSSKDSSQK